jgi:hypothetical protein
VRKIRESVRTDSRLRKILSQDNDLRIRWRGTPILESVLCRDDYKRNHPCTVRKWFRAAGVERLPVSDYLARFQSSTWRKVDPELTRRWEWDARFHGDKNIKVQAASAKRAATTMMKMPDQFSNVKPEHELALKAAASALRAMAEELKTLAGWAKDYHAFCASEMKKEEGARLEAVAQARWGNDESAVEFETSLIQELGTPDGRLTFAAWCHSVGKYRQCALEQISCQIDHLSTGPTPRMRAALTIEQAKDMNRGTHLWDTRSGPMVTCSWRDYEEYLAYRKEVAKTSARVFQIAGRQP